jgi:beta-phosphoglucomutase
MQTAFIFDMDGTMIDNMRYHFKAWRKITDELNGKLDDAALRSQLYGKNEEVLGRIFGKDAFTPGELEDISERKEVYYRSLYKDHMQLIPGLKEFLERAYRQNIPMALGTASYLRNIDLMLDMTNTRKYFKAIIGAGDVTKSKPDPETYLLAAEKLSMSPADCIVFEDVPKGVEAAANAGMKAVVITTQHEAGDFKGCGNVLRIIHDYVGLDPEEIILPATTPRNPSPA